MSAFIYWTTKAGAENTLWFDVTTEEGHHLKAEVTEHPVEEGINVTDNVRPEADELSLTCFISNTPIKTKANVLTEVKKTGKIIGAQSGSVTGEKLDVKTYDPPLLPTPGSLINALSSAIGNLLNGKKEYKAQVLKFSKDFDNVQETYFALKELRDTGQRVEVITTVRTYKDMVVVDVSMPRTSEHGTGAAVTIQLKEIRVVSTLKVKAPRPADSLGAPRKNQGAKGPSDADDPSKKESTLFKGLAKIGAVAKPPGVP
jgi:hypothetical protein